MSSDKERAHGTARSSAAASLDNPPHQTAAPHASPTVGAVDSNNPQQHHHRSSGGPQGTSANSDAADSRAPRGLVTRVSAQRLKVHIPPAQKDSGGGGTHSPAHQSNSTSPFYMGSHDSTGGGRHEANHNDHDANRRPAESAFAARQPTPSHTNEDTASPSMSPPEGGLYPTSDDVRDAQLTAFEEVQPRGSAWGIPSIVVLRHRMGFSTVELTAHQRKTYSRYDLENFVLYKEQKYNAVNVLWRFCLLLLLVLTFSVFCLVFSTCTTEWVGLQRVDNYLSLGLFVACRDRSLQTCASRVSSRLQWTVTDVVTGTTLCTASASFVQRYIGAIWTMAILQLLCEVIAVLLTAWIIARPTRNGALVVLFCDLFFGTACGIVAVVLFHHYSSCVRRTCEGEHLSGRLCNISWRYGYKLYLGALAVHGVALLLAFCMHSYIHNIRVTARKQLRAERHRASRRHADAEDYMVHVLDSSVDEFGNAAVEEGPAGPQSPNDARRLAATQRGGGNRGDLVSDHAATPLMPTNDQLEQLAHSNLHVSFADARDVRGTPKPTPRDPPNGEAAARTSSLTERDAANRTDNSDGAAALTTNASELTDGAAGPASELSPNTSFPPPTQRRRRAGSPAAYPTGDRHRPQHRHVSLAGSRRKRASADTPAYKQARKRSRFLLRFFQREYDANYLTAAELGVPIAGATDWVYDDRSDMYYSFERNMFWDPLTREYYNCALNSWQESPDQVVEVRDVLDYVLDASEDSGSGEPPEPPTNEEHADENKENNSVAMDGPRVPAVQHHGEPVTGPTTAATTTVGADSTAGGGHGPSVSSRHADQSGGTMEEGDENEPVFRADGDEDSGDRAEVELHSVHSSV